MGASAAQLDSVAYMSWSKPYQGWRGARTEVQTVVFDVIDGGYFASFDEEHRSSPRHHFEWLASSMLVQCRCQETQYCDRSTTMEKVSNKQNCAGLKDKSREEEPQEKNMQA